MQPNYKADRERLEAILDKRIAEHKELVDRGMVNPFAKQLKRD